MVFNGIKSSFDRFKPIARDCKELQGTARIGRDCQGLKGIERDFKRFYGF